MKKTNLLVLLVISITISGIQQSYGQYILKEADKQYTVYNYSRAIELYTKAYQKKKSNHAAQRLAESYRLTRNYKQAESWYGKLAALENPEAENIIFYAEALRNNSKYNEAKAQYERYAALEQNVSADQLTLWLSSCDSALIWVNNPKNVHITGKKELNSGHSDWGAINFKETTVFASDTLWEVEGDNKPLLTFDSRSSVNKHTYGWTGNPYLKLYQSKGGSIRRFPLPYSGDYHTAAASFNADGTEMYLTRTRSLNKEERKKSKNNKLTTIRIEIYSSELENGKWSSPAPFRHNNISEWSVGDPFITADGKSLYFVSDKPGGYGGTDIYVSMRQQDNSWGDAVLLGESVNTKGNERSPFLDRSNTLYFSSDGLPGMGGLDVFKAAAGSPRKAVNMGYPVNSPQDDFAFSLYSESQGYLSSNREGGAGSDDIYSFDLNQQQFFLVEGRLTDKKTQAALGDVIITVTNRNTGISQKVLTGVDGHYQLKLDKNADYVVSLEKTNYKGIGQIEVNAGQLSSWKTLVGQLQLEPITLNVAVKLDNIYYDFDSWEIRQDAARELNSLVKVLKDNSTWWIEIGSHTDSRGKWTYNQKLSQRRAQAVVNYLEQHGINASRLKASGYGESRLLSGCSDGVSSCIDADYQSDRRTEFTIMEK